MTRVIVPERFGCGLKLDFDELAAMRVGLGRPFGKDAAEVPGTSPPFLSSIDRVFQVGLSSLEFCRLALQHCTADLVASGASAEFVSASFEFGPEMDVAGRQKFSEAFFFAAGERRLVVGKCHSSTAPVTGLTLAVEGRVRSRSPPSQSNGALLLAGKLGGLEHLYLSALEASNNHTGIELPQDYHSAILEVFPLLNFATDVSGYGLAGALWELALGNQVCLDISTETLEALACNTKNPPCLQAVLGRYCVPGLSMELQAFVARREFCGPFILGCAESDLADVIHRLEQLEVATVKIGSFKGGVADVGTTP